MTQPQDFLVYNMPGMLDREVVRPDPADPGKSIRDERWYESVKEKMGALFSFFAAHELLCRPEALPRAEDVVLKFSDFTEIGQHFLKSGAPDRWLASFDRPGSKKKPQDTRYLETQLAKLTERTK